MNRGVNRGVNGRGGARVSYLRWVLSARSGRALRVAWGQVCGMGRVLVEGEAVDADAPDLRPTQLSLLMRA